MQLKKLICINWEKIKINVKITNLIFICLFLISCSSKKITFSDLKSQKLLNSISRVNNIQVNQYLTKIFKKISCPYNFEIIQDGFLAIFNNNTIFLSKNILCNLENESQLTFLLAHECAHGILNHSKLNYDESMEVQADQFACNKLINLGYDTNEGIKVNNLIAKINYSLPRDLKCNKNQISISNNQEFKIINTICN